MEKLAELRGTAEEIAKANKDDLGKLAAILAQLCEVVSQIDRAEMETRDRLQALTRI